MVLRLIREHGEDRVATAVREALQSASPRFETVRLCLHRQTHAHVPPAPITDPRLATIDVAPPRLDDYDQLTEGVR